MQSDRIMKCGKRRELLLKDGSRRAFLEDELRRMQYPATPEDWELRLLLRKSQRPRLLLLLGRK